MPLVKLTMNDSLFTEEEMIKYGIQSVSMISENTFAPKLVIKLIDGRQISSSISRNMIEDLKWGPLKLDIDSVLKNLIIREIGQKKEIKRVYSDLDPYGEEQWEN